MLFHLAPCDICSSTFIFYHLLNHLKTYFCQIKWLLKLSQISGVPEVPKFSREAESYLQNLIDQFNLDDALEVKKIEKVTNHDVKAVEYFLKNKCQSHPEINQVHMSITLSLYDFESSLGITKLLWLIKKKLVVILASL